MSKGDILNNIAILQPGGAFFGRLVPVGPLYCLMKAYGHHKYATSPSKVDARETEVQLEDKEACQWQKQNNKGKYCNFDSL